MFGSVGAFQLLQSYSFFVHIQLSILAVKIVLHSSLIFLSFFHIIEFVLALNIIGVLFLSGEAWICFCIQGVDDAMIKIYTEIITQTIDQNTNIYILDL